ncbi:MAG TPA: SPW repeat protein [Asanoa sp.]
MTHQNVTLEQHPDIAEMQARYERIAQTPTVQSVEGLTLLAGLYLAVSPWILNFSATTRDLNPVNLVSGLAVAVLALGYGAAYGRTHGLSWVTPIIGVWAIVAPWIVLTDPSDTVILSNVIAGGVIVVLGLATTIMGLPRGGMTRMRR